MKNVNREGDLRLVFNKIKNLIYAMKKNFKNYFNCYNK